MRTSNVGQYNLNLGDASFLSQAGVASSGDIVLICFWTPTTESTRTSANLTEWGMIIHTLTSDTLYTQDVKTETPFTPNCNFAINSMNTVSTDITVTDTNCNDIHTYTYAGVDHIHQPTYLGENIFSGMNVITHIDLDWEDPPADLGLTPKQPYSHQYSTVGDYDITATATNEGGISCNTQWTRRVFWRPPTVDFNISKTNPQPQGEIGLGESVVFTNISTDPDLRRTVDGWSYDWTINDTGTYGTHTQTDSPANHTTSPTHTWHNPGTHDINLNLNWYDGFTWQVTDITKQINQLTWNVSNELNWSPPVYIDIDTTYTPAITGDITHIYDVDYDIDATPIHIGLDYDAPFVHQFDISMQHTISQIINYHDGFELKSQSQDYTVIMSSIASFVEDKSQCGGTTFTSTSIAGTPPFISYRWRVYDDTTGELLSELSGPSYSNFSYMWPYMTVFKVEHWAIDSNSSSAVTDKIYTIIECPPLTPLGLTGSGGGPGGLANPVYIDPDPPIKKRIKIHVTLLNDGKMQTHKINYKKLAKEIMAIKVSSTFVGYRNKKEIK